MGPPREGAEWLEANPRRLGRDATIVVAVAVLVLVLLAVAIVVHQHRTSSAPVPSLAPGSRSGASIPPSRTPSPTPTPTRPTPRSSIVESRLQRPALAGERGYEIVGYGPRGLVRVEAGGTTLTETLAPDIVGTDQAYVQLSLVAARRFVLVMAADRTAGYVFGDGAIARSPGGLLSLATFVYPGPDPDHVWATTSPNDSVPGLNQVKVTLVDAKGQAADSTLPVPYQGSDYAMAADGTGYLVTLGTGGHYLALPAGLRRITTGALLATGTTRWLTNDCDDRARCTLHVVDRATGHRRALAGPIPANVYAVGQISPDGRYAVITTSANDGTEELVLIDLDTGGRIATRATGSSWQPQSVVWTPDSRWLLTLGRDRVLTAVDPATGRASAVAKGIPPLVAVTVRRT